MASFDRIDGQYVARCTYDERLEFKRAGWAVDPRLKRWATDDDAKARLVVQYAIGAAKERLDNIEAVKQAALSASWAEDTATEYPAPDGLKYMPFQKAGIEYAIKRTRTLIADPPGLGKTIQAIGVHNTLETKRILIVCPASLKVNWAREWRRWDVHGRSVGIAMSVPVVEPLYEEDGTRARHPDTNAPLNRTWTQHSWPDTDVVIVNYDMLLTFDAAVKARKWDLVIYDEAHLLKTADTIRTMCVFGGTKPAVKKDGKTVEKRRELQPIVGTRHIFLTGTPILSKPVELWTLIKACDPKGLGKSYDRYTINYCGAYDNGFGMDVSGASNLDELNQYLRETFMVRRDKKSVLKDLPSKTREMILLPVDRLEKPVKKERSRMDKALSAFEAMMGLESTEGDFRYLHMIDALSDKLSAALAAQDKEEPDWNAAVRTLSEPEQMMFTELAAAREEVALAKVGLVVEHILKLTGAGEPVVAFAYHKSVIDEIRRRLEKEGLRVGVITGAVPPNKRQAIVDAFQDGELDVILGNILAMGVGFTLTRGRFVVIAELDWVPALIEQAEDRAWRHGQKNAVIVQHLVVDGSIEARMAISLLEKMGVIFDALDAVREAA
jgi:SNF2 family DNA or RNA helicase